MSLLTRIVCLLTGEGCEPPWAPERDDPGLAELRAYTARANEEADALRDRRITWDRIYGLDSVRRDDGGAIDAR